MPAVHLPTGSRYSSCTLKQRTARGLNESESLASHASNNGPDKWENNDSTQMKSNLVSGKSFARSANSALMICCAERCCCNATPKYCASAAPDLRKWLAGWRQMAENHVTIESALALCTGLWLDLAQIDAHHG